MLDSCSESPNRLVQHGHTAGECTLRDMAKFIGASMQTCSQVCRYRGGSGRYRKMARSDAPDNGPQMIEALDEELASMFGMAA
ncbi:hypothetical protein [Phaeobacter sp. HF9A]|uniref:hypothetical protein n=1 Tax=Phaeobacter sp. HF9A TaxID=2721561 RepID=UPI0020CA69A9|nr:hypothetical protein [Phaeobacter sp. HF9A]